VLQNALETTVLALFVIGAIWMYGAVIGSRLKMMNKDPAPIVVRFRIGAIMIAAGCFTVGILYRAHALSLIPAIVLSIPFAIFMGVGLKWLQPYIR
jgi:fatty acid desaturase